MEICANFVTESQKMNKIISSYMKLMIKNFLTVALAVALSGSAFAFGPKEARLTSDIFKAVSQFPAPQKQKKAVTRAEEDVNSLDFTYAGTPRSAYSFGDNAPVGTEIYEGIFIPSEIASGFAGDKITSINITTGTVGGANNQNLPNDLTEVTVFITQDRNDPTQYTQVGKLGTEIFTENKITLDTPYEIEAGKGFYVGYSFKLQNKNLYYLVTDVLMPYDDNSCWVGTKASGAKSISWQTAGSQIGSLCIGFTIEGENWPKNSASLIDMAVPVYTAPGEAFDIMTLLKSTSMKVDNVEFTYTIGDADPVSKTVALDASLGFNEYDIVTISDVICDVEALDCPIKVKITKVNGEEITSVGGEVAAATFNCYSADKGFPRIALLEEGTGNWCGFCPLGIVMMDYIKEKYPEYFALVANHGDGSATQRDPMTVSSTSGWIQTYVPGFPYAIINRAEEVELSGVAEVYAQIDDYVNNPTPSILGIHEIHASIDDAGKMTVSADVKCNFNLSNSNRYRMNYYITQDGMGPYKQTNYYAAAYGMGMECAGWEKKAASVTMTYDEVTRVLSGGINGTSGISNSLPSKFEAGVDCTSSETTINVKDIKADEFKLIAFITDRANGEVVNAKVVTVANNYYAGVDEIAATDADVVSKTYYNVNGVEVKDPSNGIFIVRSVYSDGTVKAEKVVVE